jgi:hypothetical protein
LRLPVLLALLAAAALHACWIAATLTVVGLALVKFGSAG